MRQLGAVVLAAGLSSRMRAFKPLLRVGGKTMIARVVAMMKRAGAEPVVVVTGYRRELLEAHLRDSGVVFVHNARFEETQMLDSLLLGLDTVGAGCEKIMISPADVPLVRPETVEGILGARGQFVRPMYRGEPGHPVVLSAGLLPILKGYRGTGGLRGAIESSGILRTELPVDDRGVILDCDTQKELIRLRQYYQSNEVADKA